MGVYNDIKRENSSLCLTLPNGDANDPGQNGVLVSARIANAIVSITRFLKPLEKGKIGQVFVVCCHDIL